MGLVGYDWEPQGVDLATRERTRLQAARDRHQGDYVWQQGASLAAETLATGKELLITPEHALHVVEIIVAARESQETGRRIDLTFDVQVAGSWIMTNDEVRMTKQ